MAKINKRLISFKEALKAMQDDQLATLLSWSVNDYIMLDGNDIVDDSGNKYILDVNELTSNEWSIHDDSIFSVDGDKNVSIEFKSLPTLIVQLEEFALHEDDEYNNAFLTGVINFLKTNGVKS